MKTLLLLFIGFLLSGFTESNATNSVMLVTKDKDMNVALNNVCEYYAQVVICNGNSASGIHPNLGFTKCSQVPYVHFDSLAMDTVQFLQMADIFTTPWGNKIMFIGNEHMILSYDLTYGNHYCDTLFIIPQDTLNTDSVSGICINYDMDRLAVVRKSFSTPNFIYYDTSFGIQFSLQLNMIPKLVSLPAYPDIAGVVGTNQNNETVLNIIDLNLQQVILDTVLGPEAVNPVTLNFLNQQNLLLATSPGDSNINVIKYNQQSGVFTHATAFSGSGIHVATWQQGNLHFQPTSDTSANGFQRQVKVFNCNSMSIAGTFNIDKRLSVLSNPVNPNGYFTFFNTVYDTVPDKVYIYDWFTYILVDSFQTHLNPSLFISDYRCPVKVEEYDDSKVRWTVYPNPSMDDFKLSASGLICGRDYNMDIIDEEGKIVYQSTVHSKMTIVLPTAHLEAGIYFVRIHTLNGPVVQQIIKQ